MVRTHESEEGKVAKSECRYDAPSKASPPPQPRESPAEPGAHPTELFSTIGVLPGASN